jgi:hypothetical protein
MIAMMSCSEIRIKAVDWWFDRILSATPRRVAMSKELASTREPVASRPLLEQHRAQFDFLKEVRGICRPGESLQVFEMCVRAEVND